MSCPHSKHRRQDPDGNLRPLPRSPSSKTPPSTGSEDEANPNDRAFFDPKAGEIVWSNRDGMKDYEMEELAARHLVGELVEMPQCESEREVEDWFLERGFKVEWI